MGRPRAFDRDKAVKQAMHLLWQNGYASTSAVWFAFLDRA